MTRGSVAYTAADDAQAIYGLGISDSAHADEIATALAADATAATTMATAMADRLVTYVESDVQSGALRGAGKANEFDTIVAVEGIEVEDTIVSAIKLRADYFIPSGEAVAATTIGRTLSASLYTDDITLDAAVTDTDEVTFADVEFEPGSTLILTYMDVSRPDENE